MATFSRTPTLEAFAYAFEKINAVVDADFSQYLEEKKKGTRAIQKLPRKIIRDFINSCNSSDEVGIIKNLDENFVYEIRKNWKSILRVDGITEFKEILRSSEQQLFGKDFKIRSDWSFNLPKVNIGVKYFPVSTDTDKQHFRSTDRSLSP